MIYQKPKYAVILILLSALFANQKLSAQKAEGQVLNAETEEPAPEVHIRITQIADTSHTIVIYSDDFGAYSVTLPRDSISNGIEEYVMTAPVQIFRERNRTTIKIDANDINHNQNAIIFNITGAALGAVDGLYDGNKVLFRFNQNLYGDQTIIFNAGKHNGIFTAYGGIKFNQPWTFVESESGYPIFLTDHKKSSLASYEDYLFEITNLEEEYQPYSEVFNMDLENDNVVTNYLKPWPAFMADIEESILTNEDEPLANAWSVLTLLDNTATDSAVTNTQGKIIRNFTIPNWPQDRLQADTLKFSRIVGAEGYHQYKDTLNITEGTYNFNVALTPIPVEMFPHYIEGIIASPYSLLLLSTSDGAVLEQITGSNFSVQFENNEEFTIVEFYLEHDDLYDTLCYTKNIGPTDTDNVMSLNKTHGEYLISGVGTNSAPVIFTHGEIQDTVFVENNVFDFGRLVLDAIWSANVTLLSYLEGYESESDTRNIPEGITDDFDLTLTPITVDYPHNVSGDLYPFEGDLQIIANGVQVYSHTQGSSYNKSFRNSEEETDIQFIFNHNDLFDTIDVVIDVKEELVRNFNLTQLFWEYFITGDGTNGANVRLQADGKTWNETVTSGNFDFGRTLLDSDNEYLDFLATLTGYNDKTVNGNYPAGSHSFDMTQTPSTTENHYYINPTFLPAGANAKITVLNGPGTTDDELIFDNTNVNGSQYNLDYESEDTTEQFCIELENGSEWTSIDDTISMNSGQTHTETYTITEIIESYPHHLSGTLTTQYKLFRITADGEQVHTQTTGNNFDINFDNEEETTDVQYYMEYDDLHDTLRITRNVIDDTGRSYGLTQIFWEYFLTGTGTNGANVRLIADETTSNRIVSEENFDFGRTLLNSDNEYLDLLATLTDYVDKPVNGNYAAGSHNIDMTQTPISSEMYATAQGTVLGNGITALGDVLVKYMLQDSPYTQYEFTTTAMGGYQITSIEINEEPELFTVEVIASDIVPYSVTRGLNEGTNMHDLTPRLLDFVHLTGRLIDMESGEGLSGKPVKLENASGTVLASTTTDGSGYYLLPSVDEDQTIYMSYGGNGHKAMIDAPIGIPEATEPNDTLFTVNIAVPGQTYNGTSYTANQAKEMAPVNPNVDAADGSQDVWLDMTESEKDAYHLDKTTGDGIFGHLNLNEVGSEQTYYGWNIDYRGSNTTVPRFGTANGINVIVGGDVHLGGGEAAVIKEIFGRTHGFGDVGPRTSFMNLDASMPTTLDVALYKLLTTNANRMFSSGTAEHQIKYYLYENYE